MRIFRKESQSVAAIARGFIYGKAIFPESAFSVIGGISNVGNSDEVSVEFCASEQVGFGGKPGDGQGQVGDGVDRFMWLCCREL